MQKAKVEFDMSNPAHRLYVTIFELMPKANVFQINDLLKAEGFTPWTRDCEEKKRYANSTEHWLDSIEEMLDYKAWYLGHWHINKRIDKLHFLMHDVEILDDIPNC